MKGAGGKVSPWCALRASFCYTLNVDAVVGCGAHFVLDFRYCAIIEERRILGMTPKSGEVKIKAGRWSPPLVPNHGFAVVLACYRYPAGLLSRLRISILVLVKSLVH